MILIVRKRKGTDVAFELWQNNEARGKLGEGTVDSKGNITVTWVRIIKGDWGPADVGRKMPFGRIEGKKWTLKPALGGDGRIREFEAKLEE